MRQFKDSGISFEIPAEFEVIKDPARLSKLEPYGFEIRFQEMLIGRITYSSESAPFLEDDLNEFITTNQDGGKFIGASGLEIRNSKPVKLGSLNGFRGTVDIKTGDPNFELVADLYLFSINAHSVQFMRFPAAEDVFSEAEFLKLIESVVIHVTKININSGNQSQ